MLLPLPIPIYLLPPLPLTCSTFLLPTAEHLRLRLRNSPALHCFMIENHARDAHTVHPQKTKKKNSIETKATDSNAVTSGQTTSSTIDRLSSGHHLSRLRGAHPIGDLNADADRHQDILSCSLDCSLHFSDPALAFSLVSTGFAFVRRRGREGERERGFYTWMRAMAKW
ncbi:hypothetical protein GBA52_018201 [Prunus armeniaca]|nr:hypothetical protein GBA52_018201 [Prunus armeniaca]